MQISSGRESGGDRGGGDRAPIAIKVTWGDAFRRTASFVEVKK
jgi:hypothetical protein